MKKVLLPAILLASIIVSCKKNDDTTSPVTPETYMNSTAGSYRIYNYTDNANAANNRTDSTTSTSRDTTINTKSYHIFSNQTGNLQYFAISGNDYFQYQKLPAALGGTSIENLYLKTNATAGLTWPQTFSIIYSGVTINLTLANSITATGLTRTVNGIGYSDVIQVTTLASASAFGTVIPITSQNITAYYAPKVGLIENTFQLSATVAGNPIAVDNQTKLVKAVFP